MILDRNQIRNNFSRSSREYDKNTSIQKISAQTLIEGSLKYTDLKSDSNILDLGSGTGNIAKLLDGNSKTSSNLISCDFSHSMLESQPTSSYKVCGDVCQLPFLEQELFTQIYSSFCLQWIAKNLFGDLLESVYKVSKKNSQFSFCLPVKGSFHEFFDANSSTECNFKFIEFFDPTLIKEKILCSNFKILKIETLSHRVRYADAIEFLRKIKASGANYNSPYKNNSISRKKIKKISDILFEKYDNYITWNVLHCHLIKK